MVKLSLKKSQNSFIVEAVSGDLSEVSFSESDVFDLVKVKDDVFVLVKDSNFKKNDPVSDLQKKFGVSVQELEVLKQLDAAKFSERVQSVFSNNLSLGQRKILSSLMDKQFVSIYKNPKYKEGIYSIAGKIFPLIKVLREQEKQVDSQEKTQTITQTSSTVSQAKPVHKNLLQKASSPLEALEKYGYVVIAREDEAKEISSRLERQIKAGEVLGNRGFDKKFYVAMKWFYAKVSDEIRSFMVSKSALSSAEIAKKLSMDEDACRVCLMILSSEGEVIENSKGFFRMV